MNSNHTIWKVEPLMERLSCPVCGKRAADVSSKGDVELELKCPHCHKLVKLSFRGCPKPFRRVG